MKNVIIATGLAVVVATLVHAQATLAGKWEGTTPAGAPVTLDLAVTKTVLTGTLTTEGQSMPINDGKVMKNTFTFHVVRGDQTVGFSGELDAEQIRIWMDRNGPTKPAILKRVKK